MVRVSVTSLSVALAMAASARAETTASAAMAALKGVCLADATKPFASLAGRLGYQDEGPQTRDGAQYEKWSKQTDDGKVVMLTKPAPDVYHGSVCSVNANGPAGAFLKQAETFLLDAQFGRDARPKSPGLEAMFRLEKLSFDGHHAWAVVGGAKAPTSAGEASQGSDPVPPTSFVQVSYFTVKYLN